MLCDRCKKREAVVHITAFENGRRTDLHLCAACANQEGPFAVFQTLNIIDNDFFRKMAYPDYRGQTEQEPQCNGCGMTYSEFNRLGAFGCSRCYEAFAGELPPLLRRILGHSKHTCMVPNRGTGVLRTQTHIKLLRQHLQQLVRDERYEEAAKVRDEIRALERQMPPDGEKGE